jgi:hypothetical protein
MQELNIAVWISHISADILMVLPHALKQALALFNAHWLQGYGGLIGLTSAPFG